jgi:hypothetical protein
MHGTAENNSLTLPDFYSAVDSVEYFNRLHDANDKLESNYVCTCQICWGSVEEERTQT